MTATHGPITGKQRDAWQHPHAFATTLVALFHDHFAIQSQRGGSRHASRADDADERKDPYTWHPETILYEVQDALGAVLPVLNRDRLFAGLTLLTTDLFRRQLPTFIEMTCILDGDVLEPALPVLPDAQACAWGLTEGLLLDPPSAEEAEHPYDVAIAGYVAEVVKREGLLNPPDILKLGAWEAGSWADYSFSDDPATFAAAWQISSDKCATIRDHVRNNLKRLFHQLHVIPWQHGDATDLARRARALFTNNKQSE